MNFIDYLIGLGAGVVISLTIRMIADSRKDRREALLKEKHHHDLSHSDFLRNIRTHHDQISEIYKRIEKLESRKR